MAIWPTKINPFGTILLSQSYWERKSVTVNFWQKRIADENMRMWDIITGDSACRCSTKWWKKCGTSTDKSKECREEMGFSELILDIWLRLKLMVILMSYFYLIDTRNNEKLSRCQTIMNWEAFYQQRVCGFRITKVKLRNISLQRWQIIQNWIKIAFLRLRL